MRYESLPTRHEIAREAMAAILSQAENLGLIFRSSGGGPPKFNGYAVGRHGEKHVSAEEVIADLSVKAADAMLRRLSQVEK